MSSIEHWQPVLPSASLRKKPVGVRLCGREVVLFRSAAGVACALADRCPHRGMRLSLGRVERGRLTCPYHGWSFDAAGKAESPANPKSAACAERFDVAEKYGLIWLREAGGEHALPDLGGAGFHLAHAICKVVKAPVEVLLDNFTEVEHTAVAHLLFGYDRERLGEVGLKSESRSDSVWSYCRGPQKKLPRVVEPFIKVYTGDDFTVEFSTFFTPLHARYEMWWEEPGTGVARPFRLREAAYFSPLGERESRLTALYFTTMSPNVLSRLSAPIVRRLIDYEFELDRRLIENVLHTGPHLHGCSLGRFDKALVAQRRRLREAAVASAPRREYGDGAAGGPLADSYPDHAGGSWVVNAAPKS